MPRVDCWLKHILEQTAGQVPQSIGRLTFVIFEVDVVEQFAAVHVRREKCGHADRCFDGFAQRAQEPCWFLAKKPRECTRVGSDERSVHVVKGCGFH